MARKKTAAAVNVDALALAVVETPVIIETAAAEVDPLASLLDTINDAVEQQAETIAEEIPAIVEETMTETIVEENTLENIMETVENTNNEEQQTNENVVETAAETAEEKVERRGRKHTFGKEFEKTDAIMAALKKFDEEKPSVFLMKQMMQHGLVTFDKGEKAKEGRGRRPYIYRLTEAAQKMLQAEVTAPAETEETPAIA